MLHLALASVLAFTAPIAQHRIGCPASRALAPTVQHLAACRTGGAVRAAVTGPLAGPRPASLELPAGRSGIILFDGVCLFCNRWVSFVLDNDPDGLFAFASLQSDTGRRLLQQVGRSADDLSTFIVIDADGFYSQSTAALRVAAMLRVPALNALSDALMRVPPPLRDGVYRVVADNRYSILGKDTDDATPACKLRADSMTVAERFLD
jgi:predicted DCC family thiol-disulfide oxidoreductase YuxK